MDEDFGYRRQICEAGLNRPANSGYDVNGKTMAQVKSTPWDKWWASAPVGPSPPYRTIASLERTRSERELMARWSNLRKGIVLEAACGSAWHSMILAQRDCYVIGLDLSIAALRLARSLYTQSQLDRNLDTVLADIHAMPFRDCIFDLVFNQGVLEHFDDQTSVIGEMFRVLRKGSIAISIVPNLLFLWDHLIRLTMSLLSKVHLGVGWPFGHETPMTARRLRLLFEISGFSVLDMDGVCPVLPPLYLRKRLADRMALLRSLVMVTRSMERSSRRVKMLFGQEVAIKAQKPCF